MQKTISVIMGVYNQKDRIVLGQAIDSILSQTLDDFEFLIYDDGSCWEDALFLQQLVKKDNRIRLLRGEQNKGLAHALNECLKEAKGTYIARMDADDSCAKERFQVQKEFLDRNETYAFVGLNAKLFDNNGVWGLRKMRKHPQAKDFLKHSPYIHPSVMFRKWVLDEAGGYLESEDTRRCEDYELFMRLYCMGHFGCNLDKTLFSYREDRTWYDKRNFLQRIAEMKIRYGGFKAMGILNVKSMIYVMKPILMLGIPNSMRSYIRKKSITTLDYERK